MRAALLQARRQLACSYIPPHKALSIASAVRPAVSVRKMRGPMERPMALAMLSALWGGM